MIAAVGGVGIEVFFRQAHLGEVLAGRRVRHDRVRRREVIGRDVVAKQCQGTHALQRALVGQRAFPIRWATDIGGHRAPSVEWAHFDRRPALALEHRDVDIAELLRLHALAGDSVDLFIGRPQILEQDRQTLRIVAERIALDVEANRACQCVSDDQRRRGEECLLGIRVDTAIEVAIAGQHGRGVQIAVYDLLLDLRVQRTGHAVAGRAGERHDTEAEFLQFRLQAGFFQVERDSLRARRQRALHPWFTRQARAVRIACQQASRNHVAWIGSVGAAGDRGDDHRAVWHLARHFLPLAGNALGGEIAGRDACMRIARAGHGAHHARQIEGEQTLIHGALQAVRPQTRLLRIGLNQLHLFGVTAGQRQIVQRLLIDGEHRGRRAIFRRHIGDGRAIAQGQRGRACAVELEVGTHYLRLTQVFGQRQHDIGGGDPRLALAGEFDADDFWQTHPRRATQHHVLGLKAADADGDHAQRIDVRRVAVGAHAGIGEGHAIQHLDHRRHLLQIDLMHDAVAGRDHVDVVERELGPVDEVEAIFVAAIFDGAVLLKGLRVEATALDGQRMIDDQLHRHDRIDLGRITALIGNRVTQPGEIDQRGLAKNVVTHDARRVPREVEVAFDLDDLLQAVGDDGRIRAPQNVLGMHARGVG